MAVGDIVQTRRVQGHCAAGFYRGFHGEQHTLNIWVVNDRHGFTRRAIHRTALHALFGVLQRFLVRTLHNADALHTDAETRRVHHDEHVFETTIFFTDQFTQRAAVVTELQYRGRAGFDAKFVLQRQGLYIVGRTQATIGVDQKLRHDE